MAQNKYQLEGRSLPGILAEALRTYGHTARIVESERLTAKGFLGVTGSPYYRATIEVDTEEESDQFTRIVEHIADPELDGDVSDLVALHHHGALEEIQPEFSDLIEDLTFGLRDPGPQALSSARQKAPAVLSEPGASVVVTGLGTDAAEAARKLDIAPSAIRWDLGSYTGKPLAETRRGLREAQATAVVQGVPVLVTSALRFPSVEVRSGADHPVIQDADQLWAAIDVSRKVEDTQRWLSLLAQSRVIDAVIPIHESQTMTPESARSFGLRVLG